MSIAQLITFYNYLEKVDKYSPIDIFRCVGFW